MTAPVNLTMFPSQAPGLRWYQRLRLQYCTLSPECRWTWFGLVFFILYFVVFNNCVGLLFRLLLHSILLMCTFFVLAYGYAWYTLHRRLTKLDNAELLLSSSELANSNNNDTYRHAKVLRTKLIPREPHPQLPQKVFCWLELLDDEKESSPGFDPTTGQGGGWMERTSKTAVTENDEITRGTKKEEDTEEEEDNDEDDDKDWKDVPCVIAQELDAKSNEEKIQKGDHMIVHPLDGDTMRLIYVPYQRIALGRMRKSMIISMLWAMGAWLALTFLFKGIPVVVASSQQLEDVFNTFSEWFWGGLEDWLDNVFPDDDEENDDGHTGIDDDTPACRIPWFVSVAYDAILLMQIAVPVGVYLYVRWKTRRSLFEEAPTDSYQLLRGDENEDELASNNGLAIPSASSIGTTTTPVGVV